MSRKVKPGQKSPAVEPAAGRALDASARAYWSARAAKFAEQGQHARLTETLDRLWPDADEPERLSWLSAAAPAALAASVAGRSEPLPPLVLTALARSTLEWTPETADALLGLTCVPAAFAADARAVREASALIAAGDDAAAGAALKRVGRDSALRDAQRFLRGLMAFYRGETEGARLALEPLSTVPGWSGPVAALLHRLGVVSEAPAACLDRLPQSPVQQVASIVRALAERHPNKAITLLAATLPRVDPGLARALVRDFPGALLALGVPDESVVERLKRAIPNLRNYIEPALLDALICERMGHYPEGAALFAQVGNGWDAAGTARNADSAALQHRVAVYALDDLERRGGPPKRCPDCGQFHDDGPDLSTVLAASRKLLELALRRAPDALEIWLDLVRVVEAEGDKAERGRVLERFVARFPDHPTAILSAGEACLERGAFDKGVAYAEAAMVHLPFDRSPRNLACRLLLEKSRKKFRDDRSGEALGALRRAIDLPHLDLDLRQRVTAAQAVLQMVEAPKTDFVALRAAATANDPRPWLWTARFAHEWWRFRASGRKRDRMVALPDGALVPMDVPLGPEEMSAILRAVTDMGADDPMAKAVAAPIAAAAGGASPESLTRHEDCLVLLNWRPQTEAGFRIAKRGLELAPDHVPMRLYYYERGLELGEPVSTYDGAEAWIARKLHGPEAVDSISLRARLESVRLQITAVRRAEATPKPAKPSAKAPKRAARPEPSAPAPKPQPVPTRETKDPPKQLELPWE
jgi:tetratricopeptide (TPR) repeat protein